MKVFFSVLMSTSLLGAIDSCEQVAHFLAQYKRPWTLLVISSSAGTGVGCWASVAQRSPASCVVFWQEGTQYDASLVPSSLVILTASCSKENLKELAECEHFDVILVTGFGALQGKILELCAQLGDYLITDVSVPPSLRRAYRVRTLAHDKNQVLNIVYTPKKILFKSRWKTPTSARNYTIKSTFKEKAIYKPKDAPHVWQSWVPGINMYTFQALGGVVPTRARLKRAILDEAAAHPDHPDMFPNNFIVQGRRVVLIDGYQKREVSPEYCLQQTWEIMGLTDVEPEDA